MIIKVTQEHIDRGIIGDCGECPVALAIREVLPFSSIQVGNNYCEIIDHHSSKIVILPDFVLGWITCFDFSLGVSLGVKPFEFELDYEPNSN